MNFGKTFLKFWFDRRSVTKIAKFMEAEINKSVQTAFNVQNFISCNE